MKLIDGTGYENSELRDVLYELANANAVLARCVQRLTCIPDNPYAFQAAESLEQVMLDLMRFIKPDEEVGE